MIKLFNDDYKNALSSIQDHSIDLVLTDPPYLISKRNNFKTMGRSGIDFGEWDKGTDDSLLHWITLVSKKVTKNGSIICFCDWKKISYVCDKLDSSGFTVKDPLRWIKTNPMPRNRDRRYITDYEFAVWAVKRGSKWTFNRKDDTYDRPKFTHAITSKSEKVFGGHPTQKPIELMKDLVIRHSNPNDVILDPFMGSGSTGVACKQLNRNFIGIELNETYFKMAEKRLE